MSFALGGKRNAERVPYKESRALFDYLQNTNNIIVIANIFLISHYVMGIILKT